MTSAMPCRYFLFALIGLASSAAARPQPLGIFGQWGAFAEPPLRCYAISEALGAKRDGRPFASVAYWPAAKLRAQLHVRLSQPKRDGSAILLKIGERSFQLVGKGMDAWAPDASSDFEIVNTMRRGVEMVVETRGARGALIRDRYQLRGAPSAIDAAALACARR